MSIIQNMPMRWVGVLLLALSANSLCFAQSGAKSNLTRVMLVNEISQINAAIYAAREADKAQKKQIENGVVRDVFHFSAWRDSQGVLHQGLIDDLQSIKQGIQAYLKPEVMPIIHIQALNGDYTNKTSTNTAIN